VNPISNFDFRFFTPDLPADFTNFSVSTDSEFPSQGLWVPYFLLLSCLVFPFLPCPVFPLLCFLGFNFFQEIAEADFERPGQDMFGFRPDERGATGEGFLFPSFQFTVFFLSESLTTSAKNFYGIFAFFFRHHEQLSVKFFRNFPTLFCLLHPFFFEIGHITDFL